MTERAIFHSRHDAAADGVIRQRFSELPAIVGRARGYALSVGALAIACATSPTLEERMEHAAELQVHARQFLDAVAAGWKAHHIAKGDSRLIDERRVVIAFAARVADLPVDGLGLSRDDAIDLARESRELVLPALYAIIAVIQQDEGAEIERRMKEMQERAVLVEGMFLEISRIGKMIGFVSINASVEAARAGGASGRAFQVIAKEVRTLALRSADVLAQMKSRVTEETMARHENPVGEIPAPSARKP